MSCFMAFLMRNSTATLIAHLYYTAKFNYNLNLCIILLKKLKNKVFTY